MAAPYILSHEVSTYIYIYIYIYWFVAGKESEDLQITLSHKILSKNIMDLKKKKIVLK